MLQQDGTDTLDGVCRCTEYMSVHLQGFPCGSMVQPSMSASILYCMQNEGLVDNYFLAHYFHGYNKYDFSPHELYERLP